MPPILDRVGQAIKWFVMRGDRSLVAALIVFVYFGFFALVVAVGRTPLQDLQAVYYIYGGLIAGNVTLVTIVVSINQLLLPRIMYRPAEIETQINDLMEFRGRIESATGEIAPTEPSMFLKQLVETVRSRAQDVGGMAHGPESHLEGFDDFVSTLSEHLDRVDRMLDDRTATFEVLAALIETNYAGFFNRLRHLRAIHGDALSEDAHAEIDDLLGLLKDLDVSRQYFKSIYIQQELSTLSKIVLVTGLPAIGVLVAALLALTVPATVPARIDHPGILLTVTLTIGMVPLSVLASFILRTSTVVRKTTTTPPFVSPEHDLYFGELGEMLIKRDE